MVSRRRPFWLLTATVLLGCADTLSDPPDPDPLVKDPAVKVVPATLEGLYVSEARPAGTAPGHGAAVGEVAYLSVPPETLAGVVTVSIRNLTAAGSPVTVPVVNGGFDPVPVLASADDQLELRLALADGALVIAFARVPPRRPPVIVRTIPPKGRTDVALGILPTVIFSEPIDGRTLVPGLRLYRGAELVAVESELIDGQPWAARLRPGSPLEPATAYELRISRAVQDVEGDSLVAALAVPFTTDTATTAPPPPPAPPPVAATLVVSEPQEGFAYVSRISGVEPIVASVSVRNLTTGAAASPTLGTGWGGFDPVAIAAAADDELQVTLSYWLGGADTVRAAVPAARAPVLLRAEPEDGAVEVDARTVPTLVFSEPIDSTSLSGGIELAASDVPVAARFQRVPQRPWAVQATLASGDALAGATTYALRVGTAVRDLAGDALEVGDTTRFLTAAVPAPPGPPPTPPAGSRLAFVSDRRGSNEIFTANGDGSGVTPIAAGQWPRWSADGTRIVYMGEARDGTGTTEIRVVDADGANDQRIGYGDWPSWSPDGTRIVFVARWPKLGIYTMDADGTDSALLLDADSLPQPGYYPGYDDRHLQAPVYSPDGTLLVFEWMLDDGGWPWLWLVGADGRDARPLSTPARTPGLSIQARPAWSPDGARIAFRTLDASGNQRMLASLDGAGGDFRSHAENVGGHVYEEQDWSPDGRFLAFTRTPPTWWQNSRIQVLDTETGALGQLIPEDPDPAFLAYRDWGVSWARSPR